MISVKELEAKRKEYDELKARQKELSDILTGNGDGAARREWTEEEQSEWDNLVSREKELNAELDEAEKSLAQHANRANDAAQIAAQTRTHAAVPQMAAAGSGAHGGGAETGNGSGATVPSRNYAVPRRHYQLRAFRGEQFGMRAEERAYRFGHFMRAVATASLPTRYAFYDSVQFCHEHMGVRLGGIVGQMATQFMNVSHGSGAGDTTGGQYLVPEEFDSDLINLRLQYGVARRLFRRRPMQTDTRNIPRRRGGLTAYFREQGAAGTESNKSWDNVQLVAKDLMVIGRYNRELGADSIVDLGDDLAQEITLAFTTKEDQCAFDGDGTSTYDGIIGVRTKLQDFDLAGTDSIGLVTGTGNLYSELVLSDFTAVIAKVPTYAMMGAVWVASPTFYYQVMLDLELAQGGSTREEVVRGEDRPARPIFLGKPVELAEVMPTTEANSQVCCLLGDFSQGASFGDREQDEISFSEEATVGGENLWERNQIGIRGTERFDIVVHDVGDATNPGPICGLETAAS